MDIEWTDYLSLERQTEIVEDTFRELVRERLDKITPDVLLGNAAYSIVWAHLAEFGIDEAVLTEKVATVIRNLTEFTVFRPGSYGTPETLGHKFLVEAVRDNKDVIAKRVRRIINQVGVTEVEDALVTAIREAFTQPEREGSE